MKDTDLYCSPEKEEIQNQVESFVSGTKNKVPGSKSRRTTPSRLPVRPSQPKSGIPDLFEDRSQDG